MSFMDLPLDAPEKPNKGHEGGACNRRSCQAEPALWWNHGSYSWYCTDCARDIGDDVVNKRHWLTDFQPECGHPQFETRKQMTARQSRKNVVLPEDFPITADEGRELIANPDFMDSDLYEKLFTYYCNNGDMPYGTAKARTGDPGQWIFHRLEEIFG